MISRKQDEYSDESGRRSRVGALRRTQRGTPGSTAMNQEEDVGWGLFVARSAAHQALIEPGTELSTWAQQGLS